MKMGRIHSFESMGLVDGPGIRNVVFFQGCSLRCSYCHNPDTWSLSDGTEISPEELINKIIKFKPYFKKSSGGVTFSGGEPLLQPEFLLEMLKLCKKNSIHTALDTAGFGLGNYDEILEYVDLIILDIKHSTEDGYKELTGKNDKEFWNFLGALKRKENKLWIRHVVVPGITDEEKHIKELAQIISELKNVEKVELLPYHTLGVSKYENMCITYKLKEIEPMDREKTLKLQEMITSAMKISHKD